MNSLVTGALAREITVPALATTFAAIATTTLITLLVVREIARALEPRYARLVTVLAVGCWPLIAVFVAIAAARLRGAV